MKGLLFFAAMLALFGALSSVGPSRAPQQAPVPAVVAKASGTRTILLAGQVVHISTADTPAQRERGLGGREGLVAGEGMLFVFPRDGEYAFWMKDMRFSIDIVWLSAQGRVVYMAQSVAPSTYPHVFAPDTPARYVLELPAGYAKAHEVKIGDAAVL